MITIYACIKIGKSYCVLRSPSERALKYLTFERWQKARASILKNLPSPMTLPTSYFAVTARGTDACDTEPLFSRLGKPEGTISNSWIVLELDPLAGLSRVFDEAFRLLRRIPRTGWRLSKNFLRLVFGLAFEYFSYFASSSGLLRIDCTFLETENSAKFSARFEKWTTGTT